MKRILSMAVVAFLAAAFIAPSQVFAGIGVSPATLDATQLRPGTTFSQELVFSQADPDEELILTLEPDFPNGINEWFNFEPGREFTIEPGVQRVNLTVNITVPEGVEIDEGVEGAIRVKVSRATNGNAAIEVVRGAKIDVNLATTDESVVQFNVRSIEISDIDERGLGQVTAKVENTGNIAAAPSRIALDILNLDEQVLKSVSVSGFDPIDPGRTATQSINFTAADLPGGEYFVNAAVILNDEVLREERLVLNKLPADVSVQDAGEASTDNPELQQFLAENRLLALMLVIFIATSFTALVVFLFKNDDGSEEDEKQKKSPKNKSMEDESADSKE